MLSAANGKIRTRYLRTGGAYGPYTFVAAWFDAAYLARLIYDLDTPSYERRMEGRNLPYGHTRRNEIRTHTAYDEAGELETCLRGTNGIRAAAKFCPVKYYWLCTS